jgi:signal transduction histidine kinase
MATPSVNPVSPAARRLGRERWWGLAAGVVVAAADTALMTALGVSFVQWNGRDVSLPVLLYFGGTFALLGFLFGYAIEGRRRDRAASAVIQAQTETITAARARLVQGEKLAALGQLATAIAHEVRNPLAVIRSAAQGLGETAPDGDEETRRAMSFITAEIDRLGAVVNSLLAFARPPQLQPRPVPVAELVDRALLLAAGELAAKDVRVRRTEARDLPAVSADADLICQVLLGLLTNAGEAVEAGGEVAVEARRAGDGVELAVADSGPGVPPEMRAKIFEPFFTTRARGTGLGLAVARQIVEAHGGRIEVGERAGGGARFAVRLPAALAA